MKPNTRAGGMFQAVRDRGSKGASRLRKQSENTNRRQTMSEYCKYCGREYRDARTLLSLSCPSNPNGRNHELFEGDKNGPFLCVHCGREYRTLRDLVTNSCPRNSNGRYHDAFEGNVAGPFTCKYCGREYRKLRDMVTNSCSRNPQRGGTHSPAR